MRLQISRSKNSESFYVIRSVYEKGKNTTVVYEKLGTLQQVKERAGDQEPHVWAKAYVAELNRKEAAEKEGKIQIALSTEKTRGNTGKISYEAGHLFLQKLFYRLGWNQISVKAKAGTDSDIPLNKRAGNCMKTSFPAHGPKKWNCTRYIVPWI